MAARTEADEFGAFVRRIVRAYSRRVGDRDIEALAGLVALRRELDSAITDAVADLHGDYSWTDVARVLGVTRQAAQLRFGRRAAERRAARADHPTPFPDSTLEAPGA